MCLTIIKPMMVELDITHLGVFVSSFWAICSCDKLLSMVLVLRQNCTFYYDDVRSSPKKLDFSALFSSLYLKLTKQKPPPMPNPSLDSSPSSNIMDYRLLWWTSTIQ
jgi:hypothetical protein